MVFILNVIKLLKLESHSNLSHVVVFKSFIITILSQNIRLIRY